MRIAMVSAHASPLAPLGSADAGGQSLHVGELSAALTRQGHPLTVYTRRDSEELPERVRTAAGYDVVHVPAGPPRPIPEDELLPYLGDFAAEVRAAWRHDPPQLVHAHFWLSGFAALLAARDIEVPVVQTFHVLGAVARRHEGLADTSPPERARIEQLVGASAARILATSTDEVVELLRLGMRRELISVVPCGVDVDHFRPVGPVAERGATHRLVTVGRLVPRKGFDTAITALRGLPDTELIIAGGPEPGRLHDDPEARRLLAQAREEGVADRVTLVGRVARADLPSLLRSADAVVCTPWYEPFGVVALEAMACGVPVVASAVGGLADTVVDGSTGVHVPPGDPAALSRALRVLLADEPHREAYGLAGWDRAMSRYAWDHIARDTMRAYGLVVPVEAPAATADSERRSSSTGRANDGVVPAPAVRPGGVLTDTNNRTVD